MGKEIQLLTFQEYARKYSIGNPYDNTDYNYHAAWQDNVKPGNDGKWPTKYRRSSNVRRK